MVDEVKGRIVQSHAERVRRIEGDDAPVVGVNVFTETEVSPLVSSLDGETSILELDPAAEHAARESLDAWRTARDGNAIASALADVRRVAATTENLMPATIALARAGGTVGEWADALRDVFGEYRAPTGISAVAVAPAHKLSAVRAKVQSAASAGGPFRMLVGKPGLDGHSNGAEQIAVAARDAGFEVVYQGIRLTPDQIAQAAADEDVDVIGISILSGSHMELVPETLRLLRDAGVDAPVVVGGIIPDSDQAKLTGMGVARVYTPKDFRMGDMLDEIADLAISYRRAGNRSA
jgi:(2R)-ethylmalonyl-CoA mutase